MRIRLISLILTPMAVVVVLLSLPLANSLRNAYTREVFLNRLNDTARFAALAQQADATGQLSGIRSELHRYHQLYGIDAFVIADDRSVRLAEADHRLPGDGTSRARISIALGGRRSEPPTAGWPWSNKPMLVAEPIERGGDVVGAMITVSPTTRMRQRILASWSVIAAGGLAALIACYFVADRLARWALRPIAVLDAATNDVATGKLDARVAFEQGPPELRRLGASFNVMADNVQTSVEQQRAFVADASHQLRNPLSALLLRLDDLALRVPDGLTEDAGRALDEGKHLVGILERLLELARAEHAGGNAGRCELPELVRQRLQTWQPIAETRHISMNLRAPDVPPAWADESATAGALDVVIDNALKFSPDGSTIEVLLDHDDQRVWVSVEDSGPGLTSEDLARVGRRFWRSAGQQNVAGFGLGLSIARALLERAGGALEFRSPPGHGLEVRVVLRREGSADAW
ncbi:HAMP domain-containing histidine kinase [Jatrophihabitans telluris]|uniref:histidine kinase n=1 Tax=Jatrophihabitans telluris TaxID=2038343 RepID=A0ABY4QTT6_9ACTN|nr:HAMP domain-containing sensor histidine kinase [Jatrophihabitans telluris]UQX86743.1 HAMP domain-containing histidine kinase [Jatrophihabitans telluris]